MSWLLLRYHIIDKPACWKTTFWVHTTVHMIWASLRRQGTQVIAFLNSKGGESPASLNHRNGCMHAEHCFPAPLVYLWCDTLIPLQVSRDKVITNLFLLTGLSGFTRYEGECSTNNINSVSRNKQLTFTVLATVELHSWD